MPRSSGEGTIVRRGDGRWCAALQVEGQRQYRYGKTRAEAAEKLRALGEQARRAGGRLPTAGKLTLAEFLAEWLEQARPRLRPTTLADYSVMVRLHVAPDLGETKLAQLTPLRLARHYARLREKLSGRRVSMVHGLLHKALGDACRWGLVAANVADLVEAPRPPTPEPTLWTPTQVSGALEALAAGRGGWYGSLFAFLLASGCRQGEAAGLTWADVEFDAGTVRIGKQTVKVDGKLVDGPPKTRSGVRTIILPDWGLAAVRRQKAQQAKARLQAGAAWPGEGRVFTTERGTTVDRNNVRRALTMTCERLGLPVLRPHDLRHLSLSLLAMAGVPIKVAQQRAGHSNPAVTLRVYQHVLGDADRQAADALARVLAR